MKIKLIICFCCLLSLFITAVKAQNKDVEKAKELWEKVITAKGGREKLYAVQNLVVSAKSHSPYDDKEFSNSQFVDFYVLPDKWWSWQDQRPGFTLGINQYDFHREIIYKISEGARLFTIKPLKSIDNSQGRSLEAKINDQYYSEKEKFMEDQLIYLMETKWFQPKIESVRTEGNRFNKVNIIEVSFGKEKIEYFVDPKTNLPNQIKMQTWIEETKTYYKDAFFLEDYIEIEGVKFPQIIRRGKKTDTKTTYQVNVKYNEGLFNSPPSLDMGVDAWRLE